MTPIIVPMRAPGQAGGGCRFFWREPDFVVYLLRKRSSPEHPPDRSHDYSHVILKAYHPHI